MIRAARRPAPRLQPVASEKIAFSDVFLPVVAQSGLQSLAGPSRLDVTQSQSLPSLYSKPFEVQLGLENVRQRPSPAKFRAVRQWVLECPSTFGRAARHADAGTSNRRQNLGMAAYP